MLFLVLIEAVITSLRSLELFRRMIGEPSSPLPLDRCTVDSFTSFRQSQFDDRSRSNKACVSMAACHLMILFHNLRLSQSLTILFGPDALNNLEGGNLNSDKTKRKISRLITVDDVAYFFFAIDGFAVGGTRPCYYFKAYWEQHLCQRLQFGSKYEKRLGGVDCTQLQHI